METINSLVSRYEKNRLEYIKSNSDFSETDLRGDFLDPFLNLLGWDVENRAGKNNRDREVIRESRVNIDESIKKPDYEFKFKTEKKFYLEAKKPSVSIESDKKPSFQCRRYGWSGKTVISVLSNFEYTTIYDTRFPPFEDDGAEVSRLYKFHYTEYEEKLEEIQSLISKDSVANGSFEQKFQNIDDIPFEDSVDSVFLSKMNDWRVSISRDLFSRCKIDNVKEINEISQRMILRILFLRMCEDKGIESFKLLERTVKTNDWSEFWSFLLVNEKKYNSGLFSTKSDLLIKEIGISSDVLQEIIDDLYFPKAPFSFSVFQPELLGFVYERFLKDQIIIKNEEIVLELKPGNVDRDVVSTPWPVISKIVTCALSTKINTVQTLEELFELRVLDPASGSGSFLLSSYSLFFEKLIEILTKTDSGKVYESPIGTNTDFSVKSQLLTSCFYGADRDYLAVEVTKFSLLSKLIEFETEVSLKDMREILPNLDSNILHGDTVVESDIFEHTDSPKLHGPPIDWRNSFPFQFDFIVGNPPYLNTENMKNTEPFEYDYYKKKYKSSKKQFDKYFIFIEKCLVDLLKPSGSMGMIVSRKFSNIESGKNIRNVLWKESKVIKMDDFGKIQIFKGKLVYPAILYIEKKENTKEIPSFYYNCVKEYDQWKLSNTSFEKLAGSYVEKGNPWMLPENDIENSFFQKYFFGTVKLGDYLDAYNGIQTSLNPVYVISKTTNITEKEVTFEQVDKEGNLREWTIEKSATVHFFDGSIEKLNIFNTIKKTAFLIFPYKYQVDENGKKQSRAIPEVDYSANYPKTYKYLVYWKEELSKRSVGKSCEAEKDIWYRFGRTQALASFQDRVKVVVGVNSLGDKYCIDSSDIFLGSGGTAGECAIAHHTNKEVSFKYDLHFILGLLGHKANEYFCRKRGSLFQGGWYTRGTSVLKDIRLPVIDSDDALSSYNLVTRHVKKLCKLHDEYGNVSSISDRNLLEARMVALKDVIDLEISKLYGLENIIEHIRLPK